MLSILVPQIPLGESFSVSTHNLYLGILFGVFLWVLLFENATKGHNNGKVLIFPLLFLFFFAVTRDFVGADYSAYYEIFNTATIDGYFQNDTTLEFGFYYLNVLLQSICSYKFFGFIFFHFVILLITYRLITYFKTDISFAFALLAYMVMWYYLSFNLLRICLAASIVSYAFRYLVENRYWTYFIVVLLTFNIHMSSICMIFPALFYLLYKKYPKGVLIALSILFFVINVSFELILQYINIDRYLGYLEMERDSGIGFRIFFTYIPMFYWLWVGRKHLNHQFWEICLIFILFAFIIDFSGYRLSILGRLRVYAVVPFLIYIPNFVAALRKSTKSKYLFQCVLIFIYYIIQYYLMLPQYYWSDLIMPYKSLLF